jgi:hydrogenase maturation protease
VRAAVVGLGSALHGDDGVGCAVVSRLREHPGAAGADLVEAGPRAHLLLEVLAAHDRVIVVDCARMGLTPGSVRSFTAGAARDRRPPGRISAHEGDPLAMAELARALGCPAEMTVVAVEPLAMEPGTGLSRPVARAVAEAADEVLRVLAGPAGDEVEHD